MADFNDIVKLAVDMHNGSVQKYSLDESNEVLRQALIDANGGSTILNYKNIRDGKCSGLFALVEEILSRTVVEDLTNNDFFMSMVDFRNVPLGDKNLFLVNDEDDLFYVAEIADGTQGIRRQRLGGQTEVEIPTKTYGVKIYEELNRILAGRVDFNYMINQVAKSFSKDMLDRIFAAWTAASASDFGAVYFPTAGSYSENALLDLIAHVEAAAGGKTATLVGTKKALRAIAPSVQGIDSQNDIYNLGYYGKFFGSPVMVIPQRHKLGTTQFLMPDNVISIVATSERPIKVVREGNPLIIPGDPMLHGDLTQEYTYIEKYGIGIVTAGNSGIGRYEF